jgi:hypothetical protein
MNHFIATSVHLRLRVDLQICMTCRFAQQCQADGHLHATAPVMHTPADMPTTAILRHGSASALSCSLPADSHTASYFCFSSSFTLATLLLLGSPAAADSAACCPAGLLLLVQLSRVELVLATRNVFKGSVPDTCFMGW